ncbi:MAG: beta-glucosidase [Promethearchaeota archaeon]|jgi:beta-glucosidase
MSIEEIDEFVEFALGEMTLEEKVYSMTGHEFYKYVIKDRQFGARAYPGGGVIRLAIPPFLFTDGPRGVIITGSTCFPVSMARGASWDIKLEEEVGEVIGKEVRAHGGNLFGGVCINLLRHPSWGRAQETYGEDPFHIGQFGSALVKGVQKHNVMATIKHFAANSMENSRMKVNVLMDERTLREVYLPHFKYCIKEGCATVMSAYNKFRGEYCGHNRYLLREILKNEWKFEGFVHSDWFRGLRRTLGGILGGLDVEMPRPKYYSKSLIRKVENKQISMDFINDAVRRIIRTVLKFTTKEDPQEYNSELIACQEHKQLARKVAEKSMVLLKNKSNFLPLDLEEIKSLAVIGPLADLINTGDHGSSNVNQSNIVTPLQGIQNYVGDRIDIMHDNGKDLGNAQNIAQKADMVVITVGYTYKDEGEYLEKLLRGGGDRTNLSLKSKDIELIRSISEVNENCIAVLVGGSAIIMEEWKDKIPAILMAWYSGMEGGSALANIIFGKVNPSGKLPFTITMNSAHLPFFDKDADEIKYGYYHGYSLLDKEEIQPAFPFGFGLSYTEFKYENLKVNLSDNSIVATVDVTNIGDMKGEEVIQLYIGFENSKIDRPKKLLKGFKKVEIEPKETKNVSLAVNKNDLAYYNPKTNNWEVEKMKYCIFVGPSSIKKSLLNMEIFIE